MNYKYKSFILNHVHSKKEIFSFDSNQYYNITNSYTSYDTRYNIFIKKDFINLLKISKIRGKREKNSGSINLYYIEISLFETPLPLLRQEKNGYPYIQKKWSIKIPGKILNVKLSDDNLHLLIHYSVKKASSKVFRIRFYHDISKLEKGVSSEVKIDQNIYTNIYDDFIIEGSYKINSFAIQKNVITYSRNNDYHSFYLLERIENEGKVQWIKEYSGIKNDFEFFNIYNLKFLSKHHDYQYSLMNSFLE